MKISELPKSILERIRTGTVIPAHPLALTAERKLSERHQRALTRYYLAAGAGGIAVGVHSTQFEIRDSDVALFKPVLELASATMDEATGDSGRLPCKIAGVCGPTAQAVAEAEFAVATGYHAVLLSLAALKEADDDALIAHCQAVAEVIPVIGFYLQPSVGGRVLPLSFWRRFAQIENVIAIKMAPFNRYQTLDVVRAVCEAGRENAVTLYTGNDDNIVLDLITPYRIRTASGSRTVRIKGGLLGHWCVWTRRAVKLLERLHALIADDKPIPQDILTLAMEITDCNAAFFDPAHGFAGCIPGIHEVLRRQGLMPGTWCLNPREQLSPGQSEEIDRVYASYPHLNDDDFVREHLDEWLAE
ncbi:MAG: dihydrodipicolinate synthase family protein [Lentisphaeria bacterium]|jgi:dihydrodipicolinate synthase/N-acetylneuraminate lyase|nr:dihydrodipicolinate synthase family protein [Lentisphaeria bacterium]